MKEDKKVSWEDIAWSNMYSIEALMNILEDKGLITKQEVLGELQKLKVEHQKDINYDFGGHILHLPEDKVTLLNFGN